jgi:hypothetical protein
MQGATLDELRDLSRRSRRTLAWGALSVATTLLLLPLTFFVADAFPAFASWAAGGAVVAAGLLFLKFAHAAGQERGAFRKLFRDAKRRALARTLTPEGPAAASPAQTQ